jgi:hypothetical protein
MIWGSQYDAMMNWMAENNVAVGSSSLPDGITKASSSNTGYRVTGNPNFNDKLKNVYDLYGNSSEWTLEASSTGCRASRGGDYGSSDSPSYRTGYSPTPIYNVNSARVTLYVE